MKVEISEVFTSIQGEGPWSGRMVAFIRFAGCNLACPWCDSKYARHGMLVEVEDIVQAVKMIGVPVDAVVITGGEPTIQMEGLTQLVKLLSDAGYEVAIETNGTNDFDTDQFDLVVVSPKSLEILDHWYMRVIEEPTIIIIKWVIDPDTLDDQFRHIVENGYDNLWLMPMGVTPMEIVEGMYKISEKMKEYGVKAIVCNRMHVLMGVR